MGVWVASPDHLSGIIRSHGQNQSWHGWWYDSADNGRRSEKLDDEAREDQSGVHGGLGRIAYCVIES